MCVDNDMWTMLKDVFTFEVHVFGLHLKNFQKTNKESGLRSVLTEFVLGLETICDSKDVL